MAQNFRRYIERNIGTSAVDIPDGSDFNSYDTIIGINLANVTASAITASVYIANGGSNYYIIKDAPIPSGSSLQVLDGGAKFVVQSGDRLYIVSSAASSIDAIVSAVDDISSQDIHMAFIGRKPTNAPLTSDDIPNGIIGAADLATGLAKLTWDTSVKTSGFTASANTGYFCNTTSAAFTVTLPASPTAGDTIQLVDYAGTWDTNNLTINPNSNKILGQTSNVVASKDREAITLTYIDSTQGWLPNSGYQEGTTGVAIPYSIDFLVVAGGGGGGGQAGAGGGAGGYRTSTQTVSVGTVITVTVGDGSTGGVYPGTNDTVPQGSNSSISGSGLTTITSAGGGGAGNFNDGAGGTGGSGGGGSYNTALGASGNTPNTSPSQGNNGGNGSNAGGGGSGGSGGGGGAGANGANATGSGGGNGGNGSSSSITGSSVTYAGGGGGAGVSQPAGSGGTGGGGAGKTTGGQAGGNGTANLGAGGGGGRDAAGGNGGKGVVILSVPTASYSGTTTGSPTVTTSGSNTILTFNGSGSYTA